MRRPTVLEISVYFNNNDAVHNFNQHTLGNKTVTLQ